MEVEDGYTRIERNRPRAPLPVPKKAKASSTKCWKITAGVLLAGSIGLNVGLIIFLIGFQVTNNGSRLPTSLGSCVWIPGSKTESVTFNPNTAHPRLYVSKDQKSIRWGETVQNLPDNAERFNPRAWVLGQVGYLSGKHCWEVEVKRNGEWAVGVARQSVQRKGLTPFNTTAGVWAIGEYWGLGNYVAFSSPEATRLTFAKRPRVIRIFLDYTVGVVEFFNPETKLPVYTFNSAVFSGEKVYPWFCVWDGTALTLHP